ncbi:MAG TPA: UDP-glucose 4-epimerase GalE [Candidatus Moranbacteria bacterium]|nr:MAG: UDP-galactose 4-epimerase [Candidatus Moranbacteria bacterium GW2011_GWF1_34_10]HBI17018.1 UDP-glucose 4-epimerase GalE [Candidatus Moranbacteria bacterium]
MTKKNKAYSKVKIVVTGGAGFIGSHTVVELLEAGYLPIIIDNFSNSQPWIIDKIKEITSQTPIIYEGDCNDKTFLEEVFQKESSIEGVIHFAAFKAVGESIIKPLDYYKNNLSSLITVLETMQKFGVKNLVFSSSATVYGEPDSCPIAETAPRKISPSPYGKTKTICEDIISDTVNGCKNISAISLRYFNPIGAHPSGLIGELPIGAPNNLVPYVTQTAAGIREKLTIFGNDYPTDDGYGVRDFIHVVDLAQAHIKTLQYLTKHKSPFYDVFNVGTGKGNSVLEIIETFQKVNNTNVPREIGPRREGDIATCYADVSKIKKMMNWETKKTLEDSLRDAWKWQKSLK